MGKKMDIAPERKEELFGRLVALADEMRYTIGMALTFYFALGLAGAMIAYFTQNWLFALSVPGALVLWPYTSGRAHEWGRKKLCSLVRPDEIDAFYLLRRDNDELKILPAILPEDLE